MTNVIRGKAKELLQIKRLLIATRCATELINQDFPEPLEGTRRSAVDY